MRGWTTYHSHTHFCDGEADPEDYIREAIRNSLPAYGFSSHAPVNFPTNWCIPDNKFHQYLSDIRDIKRKYGNEIEVYLGLEIDFIPGSAGRSKHLMKNIPLDYFIGSIHFVDVFADGKPWNIDTSFELFRQGLEEIFKNDYRRAATRFYELTRQMIGEDKPDIIGHIDKIKMFNNKGGYFKETEKWYQEQIDLTIDKLKNSNSIVELNTRGYYRYGQSDLYPSEIFLKKLIEADIPLMINSDAHKPKEITMGMSYAANKLLSLGITKVYALHSGNWRPFSFSEEGIHWN